jgi:hypothetical protein
VWVVWLLDASTGFCRFLQVLNLQNELSQVHVSAGARATPRHVVADLGGGGELEALLHALADFGLGNIWVLGNRVVRKARTP